MTLYAVLVRLPLDSNVQVALDQVEQSKDCAREIMDLLPTLDGNTQYCGPTRGNEG